MSTVYTKRQGLTLVEVLVVSTIFVAVSFVLLAVQRFCFKAFRKEDGQSECYRRVMSTLNQLRTELGPSRLIDVDPTLVKYKLPLRSSDGETIYMSPFSGLPVFRPLNYNHRVKMVSGRVIAERVNSLGSVKEKTLGRLGPHGTIRFWMPINRILNVKVSTKILESEETGRSAYYEGRLEIFVAGQT